VKEEEEQEYGDQQLSITI